MAKSIIDKAYDILKVYNGSNNQINYLKHKYLNGNLILSDFDCQYIVNNEKFIPENINRVVKISREFGLKIQEKYDLEFCPEKIKIFSIIGSMGNSIHAYVQFRQSIQPQLMYVPNNALLNELTDTEGWKDLELDFSELDNKRKLKDHQREGVKFLLYNKKCLLCDSQGTGKTTTATCASILGDFKRVLIITTASLKTTWKREIEVFRPSDEIQIISGSEWGDDKRFTIINYDIIDNFYKVAEEIQYETKFLPNSDGSLEAVKVPITVKNKSTGKLEYKMTTSRKKEDINKALSESPLYLQKFDCIIIDEVHKLSNNKSIRYKVISDFIKKSKIENAYMLSGTPVQKDAAKLHNILKLIDHNITKDYKYYFRRYCGAIERKFNGKKILIPQGSTHLDELFEKIKNCYIRRELKNLSDSVTKTVITRYYDLSPTQMSKYNRLWHDYMEAQSENGDNTNEDYRQLVEGMLVRQFLAYEMVDNTIKLANEKIEDGEKVVIMCTFDDELKKFKEYYKEKGVVYNGKMTAKAKDKAYNDFMTNPKVKVFIANIESASVGLSLTAAKTLIMSSFSWVYSTNEQAEDRVFRISSTDDVLIIYQLFNDSVSQHIYETVMEKKRVADETIKEETNKKK